MLVTMTKPKKTFALRRIADERHPNPRLIDLWCEWRTDQSDKHWYYYKQEHMKTVRQKGRGFYVINGNWYGHFCKKTGLLTCHAPDGDTYFKAEIAWEGVVPPRYVGQHLYDQDYTTAMAWIRDELNGLHD